MSVPATDEDQPRENVSIFERYRAQSHIPVPGPASPGEDQLEDLQNTTDTTGCEYCLQTRCITSSPFKPQARGNARINNHIKRRKDYKWYWRTLKDCGLWEDPVYQARKEQLGCHIDDVREVMPHCVIKDVRERYTEEHEAQFILCPQKSEQISFLKIGWEKEGHMIFGV